MLAGDLASAFSPLVSDTDLHVLDRKALDITRREDVERLRELNPAIVINSAAYTNVDGAESERDKAYEINVRGTEHLVQVCRTLGARFVHFGTDQVFDGTGDSPRREIDEARPSNYYAQTKYLGERAALAYERSLVVRVQWLYGERKDRFTILKGREVFTPFSDQFGAPTWTREIARVLVRLLAGAASGLFHFAYDDYASWAEVYEFVKSELRLSTRLIPKRTEEVALPAKRPRFSVMSNRKLVEFLGVDGMGSWKKPLGEFLSSRL